MEEVRSTFRILNSKPIGKKHILRPSSRWEENFRIDLKEIGTNMGKWFDSSHDRDYWTALVNAALNLQVS